MNRKHCQSLVAVKLGDLIITNDVTQYHFKDLSEKNLEIYHHLVNSGEKMIMIVLQIIESPLSNTVLALSSLGLIELYVLGYDGRPGFTVVK